MRWVTRALTVGVLGLALTGCARPFPERLPWYGYHTALYSQAFDAAAQEALVRSMTGRSYYEHMGDAAYNLIVGDVCDRAGLNLYLVEKQRACHVLGGPPPADCLNHDACAGFRYDTALFSDPSIKGVVESALRDPCKYLTPPDGLRYGGAPARFGMSASDNWRIMLCENERVYGENIRFDEDSGVLRLNFRRGI